MRSTTSRYAVRITVAGFAYSPMSWRVSSSNAHLGATRVLRASIRRNVADGAVVASYLAPAFEVVA